MVTAEDGAGWLAFLRSLRAHGLIFAQPDAESVRAEHARTVEQLQPRFREATKMLAVDSSE